MAIGLAACGGGTEVTTPPDDGAIDYAKDVGVVLPTNSESRWPMAEAQLQAAMPGVKIMYSNNDTATEKTNVEAFIANGVKVLIICPIDGTAAGSEVDQAHAAGITVVAYDRLIMDTPDLDYYVTFDSVAVGEAWGDYLVSQASGTGNNLYLYAGSPADNNAFLFFEGAWNVLQPKIADGTFVIVNSPAAIGLQDKAKLTRDEMSSIVGQVATNWDPTKAKDVAESNLAAAKDDQKGDVFLLTPNDDTARAITDAFRADPAVNTIYSTGQDLAQASAQYILDGKQSMTVSKPDRSLVEDTVNIVDAVLNGTEPTVIKATYDNNVKQVPATKAPLIIVTSDNIEQVVAESGVYKIVDGKVVPI